MTTEQEHGELLNFLYTCPIGLAQVSAGGGVQFANPGFAQIMMQLDPAGWMSNVLGTLARYSPQLKTMLDEFEAASGRVCEQLRIDCGQRSPAAPFPLVLSVTVARLQPGSLQITMLDISRSDAVERAAEESAQRYRSVIDAVRDYALFHVDEHGVISNWNLSAERLFGFTSSEAEGRAVRELLPQEERATDRMTDLQECVAQRGWTEDEGWWARKGSTRFWGHAVFTALENVPGSAVVLRDLSPKPDNGLAWQERCLRDALTGLFTRAYFDDHAERECFEAQGRQEPVSLLRVDVDALRKTNARHGRRAGDDLLRDLAKLCLEHTRHADMCARMDGEDLVIFLPASDVMGAWSTAERLRQAVEGHVFSSGEHQLRATISIGLTESHPGDRSLSALLRRAERALSDAKGRGGNAIVVAPSTEEADRVANA